MNTFPNSVVDEAPLRAALDAAADTRVLRIGPGVNRAAADVFAEQFAGHQAVLIADDNTHAAAGRAVLHQLSSRELITGEPMIFTDPCLSAEYDHVETLVGYLQHSAGIPVVVGSGTLNDLVKLAAHQCGRPYMCIATAASMDGYTAYGASITRAGSKQTFFCPAPRCVLADLDVICHAPLALNGSGYADLLAKVLAGADWLVADALEVEAIAPAVWQVVQGPLHESVADPEAVRRGDPAAIRQLIVGLMMSGFAMQAHQSSRPASGAEHQFSHLWDMQGHTHLGRAPSHGHKVGIGSIASIKLYEQLLADDLGTLDVDVRCAAWPSRAAQIEAARRSFALDELADKAAEEVAAKHLAPDVLRSTLHRLRDRWPALRERLVGQLIPGEVLQQRLAAAGCPSSPPQIGIDSHRMRRSYSEAMRIRRRFTVLDLAWITGRFDAYLDRIFARPWSVDENG